MTSEEKLEQFMEEDWKKQITQEDTVDDSVEEYLGEMGWLWSTVLKKLEEDKHCFKCSKEVNFNKETPPHVVQATKVDKGVVAFISLCDSCYSELLKEQEELDEQKKKNEEEKNE